MPLSPFTSLPELDEHVLCVDVGGSAIKSVTLRCRTVKNFFDFLSGNPDAVVHREPWNPDKHGPSLLEMLKASTRDQPQRIVLSIGGSEVSSNGRDYRGWLRNKGRVPTHLADEIENTFRLERGKVSIRNDSLAWAQGVSSFLQYRKKSANDGIGLLVVGTGVAFSVITDTGVTIRHLQTENRYDWTKLSKFANFRPDDWIHDHLGTGYFHWRDKELSDSAERQQETQKRYQLLLNELERVHHVSTFIFAGGWANELAKCRFSQNHSFLTKASTGFDPGFIPMLGLVT